MRKIATARVTVRVMTAAFLTSALTACVTLPPNSQPVPQDPWESFNRGVYRFNDALDRAVAKPVARGYVKFVPEFIRIGVTNFFANLETPTVMINDALQGKFLAASNDFARFVLDTTLGLGGLFDPASAAGLARNEEDFGQTLGVWGVHPGPFIELPILGPSDLRDGPARLVDTYTNPRQYIKNDWIRYGLYLPDFVDRRAALLPLDDTLKNTYDPYAFVRDAYLQRRAYLVSDGKSSAEDLVDPEAEGPIPTNGAVPPDPSTKRNPAAPAGEPRTAPPPASPQ